MSRGAVTIAGTPLYGMFFRDVENLTLGNVDMRVTSGLGIRVDNHGRTDRSMKVQDFRLDYAYIEGATAMGGRDLWRQQHHDRHGHEPKRGRIRSTSPTRARTPSCSRIATT